MPAKVQRWLCQSLKQQIKQSLCLSKEDTVQAASHDSSEVRSVLQEWQLYLEVIFEGSTVYVGLFFIFKIERNTNYVFP